MKKTQQETTKVVPIAGFACADCGGKLRLQNGKMVHWVEDDPYSFNTITRRRVAVVATCGKCKKVIDDYFR